MFPNQSPSTIPRVNKGKGYTPKPKEEKSSGPYIEKPIWDKCGRKHEGKYFDFIATKLTYLTKKEIPFKWTKNMRSF